jgi:hypothetical protein
LAQKKKYKIKNRNLIHLKTQKDLKKKKTKRTKKKKNILIPYRIFPFLYLFLGTRTERELKAHSGAVGASSGAGGEVGLRALAIVSDPEASEEATHASGNRNLYKPHHRSAHQLYVTLQQRAYHGFVRLLSGALP